jgi:Cu2+-exporting ATPase
LVGRYLQRTHQRRSARASDLLSALAPSIAHLLESGGTRDVPADGVVAGDIVEVRQGERVAIDGVVTLGRSAVDCSLLTGESLPVELSPGERVHAGTTNLSSRLEIRVEAAGASTRLGRLMQSVETAQRERAPIVRLADRVAGRFVLAILVVAALTLLLWLWLDPAHAVDHTVALLVVTCPCALGMATPLAVSAALRKAARGGVLFKSGEFVEALSQPGVIVFDKTGTLTEGRLTLVSWLGDETAQAFARAAEANSGHPIALAFQRAFAENELYCENRVELTGGLRAHVIGRDVLVGSLSLVQRELERVPAWAQRAVQSHADGGRTPVLVAMDGQVRAVAAFADSVRSDARSSLKRLGTLGFRFQVLSGDHQRVVDSVVKELGISFEATVGGATPEAKCEAVSQLRAAGQRVFMVGDGVNDANAMVAADVGIAVHGGAEACLSAADAFTTRPGLATIAFAAEGARRTMQVIRRGIALSLGYNLIGIGFAVTGHLDPLVAAILMPLSSITVVTAALRARTFEEPAS